MYKFLGPMKKFLGLLLPMNNIYMQEGLGGPPRHIYTHQARGWNDKL